MRTKTAAAAFVLIGAGATTVAALNPPINMQGSDTLFLLTKDVINVCPRTSAGQPAPLGIDYVGSGSGNGQRNTLEDLPGPSCPAPAVTRQTITPMSRFLIRDNAPPRPTTSASAARPTAPRASPSPSTASASSPTRTPLPASCGGVAFTKTITHASGTYTANSAFDFLRVAWFGILNSDPAGATPVCGGDVRRALLGNYGNFFKSACPAGTRRLSDRRPPPLAA